MLQREFIKCKIVKYLFIYINCCYEFIYTVSTYNFEQSSHQLLVQTNIIFQMIEMIWFSFTQTCTMYINVVCVLCMQNCYSIHTLCIKYTCLYLCLLCQSIFIWSLQLLLFTQYKLCIRNHFIEEEEEKEEDTSDGNHYVVIEIWKLDKRMNLGKLLITQF